MRSWQLLRRWLGWHPIELERCWLQKAWRWSANRFGCVGLVIRRSLIIGWNGSINRLGDAIDINLDCYQNVVIVRLSFRFQHCGKTVVAIDVDFVLVRWLNGKSHISENLPDTVLSVFWEWLRDYRVNSLPCAFAALIVLLLAVNTIMSGTVTKSPSSVMIWAIPSFFMASSMNRS
jgi:hypothetical protein